MITTIFMRGILSKKQRKVWRKTKPSDIFAAASPHSENTAVCASMAHFRQKDTKFKYHTAGS